MKKFAKVVISGALLTVGVVSMPAVASSQELAGEQAASSVSGAGTNENPYVSACSFIQGHDCTVGFSARTLKSLQSEFVPAYQCPVDHRGLRNQRYSEEFATLPAGVQIDHTSKIDVSITNSLVDVNTYIGTQSDLLSSSVTNWASDNGTYRVVLHCTDDPSKMAGKPVRPYFPPT